MTEHLAKQLRTSAVHNLGVYNLVYSSLFGNTRFLATLLPATFCEGNCRIAASVF